MRNTRRFDGLSYAMGFKAASLAFPTSGNPTFERLTAAAIAAKKFPFWPQHSFSIFKQTVRRSAKSRDYAQIF
ncbi:hypothetical protein P9250_19740 [Caballeronia sp. LP006]|uniref:hypothetical protein n=1 Tax=Caballeronia sp. LP006 TaxID=3038552 RepID=UPI0028629763|nr:hypothetical protein [Caballeronia sp. LP006]MDR5830109.1 hypothetical protein [Caballeronia sp. LP006]